MHPRSVVRALTQHRTMALWFCAGGRRASTASRARCGCWGRRAPLAGTPSGCAATEPPRCMHAGARTAVARVLSVCMCAHVAGTTHVCCLHASTEARFNSLLPPNKHTHASIFTRCTKMQTHCCKPALKQTHTRVLNLYDYVHRDTECFDTHVR